MFYSHICNDQNCSGLAGSKGDWERRTERGLGEFEVFHVLQARLTGPKGIL